jgi:hypothetical protein
LSFLPIAGLEGEAAVREAAEAAVALAVEFLEVAVE